MKGNYNECPICLSNANLPIATQCGHIFCWNCIKEWVNQKGKQECPSCKSGIDLQNVVKLYSGDNNIKDGEKDDRPQQKRIKSSNPNIFQRIGNNFGLFGYTNDTTLRIPNQKEVQRNYLALIVFIISIIIVIYIFN